MSQLTSEVGHLSAIAQSFYRHKTKDVFYGCYSAVLGRPNKWLCLFCKEEKTCNVAHGYNNGLNHIKTHDWKAAMDEQYQTTLDSIVDTKSKNVYRWLKWVINLDLPLSFVNKKETRQNTNLRHLDRHTLTKYMHKVVLQVELYFQQKMPSYFGIAMDSWSC